MVLIVAQGGGEGKERATGVLWVWVCWEGGGEGGKMPRKAVGVVVIAKPPGGCVCRSNFPLSLPTLHLSLQYVTRPAEGCNKRSLLS